jgi:hypothetical protein
LHCQTHDINAPVFIYAVRSIVFIYAVRSIVFIYAVRSIVFIYAVRIICVVSTVCAIGIIGIIGDIGIIRDIRALGVIAAIDLISARIPVQVIKGVYHAIRRVSQSHISRRRKRSYVWNNHLTFRCHIRESFRDGGTVWGCPPLFQYRRWYYFLCRLTSTALPWRAANSLALARDTGSFGLYRYFAPVDPHR